MSDTEDAQLALIDKLIKEKNDSQVLESAALWFKVNVGLFVIIGSMFMFDYIGEKNTNKEQTKLLSHLETRVSISENRLDLIEKTSFE